MSEYSYAVGQTIGLLIFLLPFLILLNWVFARIFNFQDKSWKKAAIVALAASGIYLLLFSITLYLFSEALRSSPLIMIIYQVINLYAAGAISLQKTYKLKEGKAALIGILWAIIAFILILFLTMVRFLGRYYG